MIIVYSIFLIIVVQKLMINGRKFDLSVFFDFYWLFFSLVGYVFFSKEYDISAFSVGWILSASLCFGIGYYFAVRKSKKTKKAIYDIQSVIRVIDNSEKSLCYYRFLLVSFTVVFLFKCFIIIYTGRLETGMSFINVFNISRDLKYDEASSGIVSRIIDLVYYPCIIILGKKIRIFEKKQKKILMLFFILALFGSVLVDGAKAIIVFSVMLFIVGFYGHIFLKGGYSLKKLNIKLIMLCGLVFYFVMLLLLNNNTLSMMIYGFGEIPAFDWFFKNFDGKLTWGKQTFWGLVRNISHSLTFSGNENNYALPEGINLMTNIYTAFRCVISDFGFIGGWIFVMFAGFTSGKIVCKRGNGIIREGLFNWIFGFMILSFMMSIGYYFTISIAAFLAPVYCRIIDKTRLSFDN